MENQGTPQQQLLLQKTFLILALSRAPNNHVTSVYKFTMQKLYCYFSALAQFHEEYGRKSPNDQIKANGQFQTVVTPPTGKDPMV